jgi:hypothetical protein
MPTSKAFEKCVHVDSIALIEGFARSLGLGFRVLNPDFGNALALNRPKALHTVKICSWMKNYAL